MYTYVVKSNLYIFKGVRVDFVRARCSGCLHADVKHEDLRLLNGEGGGGEIIEINKGIQL